MIFHSAQVKGKSYLIPSARLQASIRDWWSGHGSTAMAAANGLMVAASAVWLTYQFWRLLWQGGRWGAIDLRILHGLVRDWFAGQPIYAGLADAIHPPATYALLWPLLGWLDVAPARWLWALTTLGALGWLALLAVRQSGAETRQERAVALLMTIAAYPTGAAIGNGQLIVHILPMLLTGLLLLRCHRSDWRSDAMAAILILVSLVKPSISAPFFWIVLFRADSLRPALVVVIGYVALTAFAMGFQPGDLGLQLADWHARSSAIAVTPGDGNVSNLHIWLSTLGMKKWILPASLFMLAGLGAWTYRHRHVDLWLLMGVTAYVARFWTYHRWYDDLLILLPMIALFRLAKQGPARPGAVVVAGTLLAATILAMLAPGGLFLFPPPWNMYYATAQVVIWLAGLIFLAQQARYEKQSAMT